MEDFLVMGCAGVTALLPTVIVPVRKRKIADDIPKFKAGKLARSRTQWSAHASYILNTAQCVSWSKQGKIEKPRIRIDEELPVESEDRVVTYKDFAVDFALLTLPMIQQRLKLRNLTTTGKNKVEVVIRLQDSDAHEIYERFVRPLTAGMADFVCKSIHAPE